MAKNRDSDHILRRFLLPSGKAIEVLRPSQAAAAAPQPRPPAPDLPTSAETAGPPSHVELDRAASGPQVCIDCDCRLVYPVGWSAAPDTDGWTVDLRCPNCERMDVVVLGQDVAERFDEELERGAETLMSDLTRLTEANMTEQLERLRAALEADALQPMDF